MALIMSCWFISSSPMSQKTIHTVQTVHFIRAKNEQFVWFEQFFRFPFQPKARHSGASFPAPRLAGFHTSGLRYGAWYGYDLSVAAVSAHAQSTEHDRAVQV